MNRIVQQQQYTVRRLIAHLVAGGLGILLTISLAGCALETATEGDTSATAAGDKTVGVGTVAGALPATITRPSPNSQPGAARGAAPTTGPGGGEDPQPSPWIGTDNAALNLNGPLDRQQLGVSVEHK